MRAKSLSYSPLSISNKASLHRIKSGFGVSLMALGVALGPVQARDVDVEEIVVTGSLVVRDGYEAPTPVTVLDADAIAAAGKLNITDVVISLPSFQGSQTLAAGGAQILGGGSGANFLNLRGLGINRNLILFNGRRFVAAGNDGAVDINQFPDMLINRIDVVTGGASALYGSDALSGVVNFLLDEKFTGVKADIQGGVTSRGDGKNYKVGLAVGTSFAGGRGHLLASGSHSFQDLIDPTEKRAWNETGYVRIFNPAFAPGNGQPQFILRSRVGLALGGPGGLITDGPLKGIAFGPGGTPYRVNFGEGATGLDFIGGDYKEFTQGHQTSILPKLSTGNYYTHVSYDVTDDVEVFADFIYSMTRSLTFCCNNFYLGNITVNRDNAFLPLTIRTQMDTAGLTQFVMGSTNGDIQRIDGKNKRQSHTYAFGAKGSFDVAETKWNWNAYVQQSTAHIFISSYNILRPNYAKAYDAVVGPADEIVCRDTLTNPNNGCVPYNLFGVGVNPITAVNYVSDRAWASQRFNQTVAAARAAGSPFSSWAGPVSVAFGAEYREESVGGTNDINSQQVNFFAANYSVFPGKLNVIEGFAETVVPLAVGESWAELLEFSGAARYASYSLAGGVATWKAGLSYSPITDLRFRATRSRDIRAPSLVESLQTGNGYSDVVRDPFSNPPGQIKLATVIPGGNPNLKPEKADTLGLGVVYQPAWLDGLGMSIDYYSINVKGAIQALDHQVVIDRCAAGNQLFCGDVSVGPDGMYIIRKRPQNFVSQTARGLDLELSYRMPLETINEAWPGNLTFRTVATHIMEFSGNDGVNVIEQAGELGNNGLLLNGAASPRWTVLTSVTANIKPVSLTLTGKFISAGIEQANFFECTTGCPAPTPTLVTTDVNHMPSYFKLDAAFSYEFYTSDNGNSAQAYFNVDNLFDRDPPLQARSQCCGVETNTRLYDAVGRAFRAGVRFRM